MIMDEKMQVNASLSDWEENMLAELAQKHGVSEDAILDIGSTFLSNEILASVNGKPCLMTAIQVAIIKQGKETIIDAEAKETVI